MPKYCFEHLTMILSREGMTFIQVTFCIPRAVPRSLIWWSFPAGFSSSCQYYFLWYDGLWNIAPVKCNEDSSSSMFRQAHSGYSVFPRSGEWFLSKMLSELICVKVNRFQLCVSFDIVKPRLLSCLLFLVLFNIFLFRYLLLFPFTIM